MPIGLADERQFEQNPRHKPGAENPFIATGYTHIPEYIPLPPCNTAVVGYNAQLRSIAQSGSASGLGPEGREFESLCSDHQLSSIASPRLRERFFPKDNRVADRPIQVAIVTGSAAHAILRFLSSVKPEVTDTMAH